MFCHLPRLVARHTAAHSRQIMTAAKYQAPRPHRWVGPSLIGQVPPTSRHHPIRPLALRTSRCWRRLRCYLPSKSVMERTPYDRVHRALSLRGSRSMGARPVMSSPSIFNGDPAPQSQLTIGDVNLTLASARVEGWCIHHDVPIR